jgi:ribosomal protein L29
MEEADHKAADDLEAQLADLEAQLAASKAQHAARIAASKA